MNIQLNIGRLCSFQASYVQHKNLLFCFGCLSVTFLSSTHDQSLISIKKVFSAIIDIQHPAPNTSTRQC